MPRWVKGTRWRRSSHLLLPHGTSLTIPLLASLQLCVPPLPWTSNNASNRPSQSTFPCVLISSLYFFFLFPLNHQYFYVSLSSPPSLPLPVTWLTVFPIPLPFSRLLPLLPFFLLVVSHILHSPHSLASTSPFLFPSSFHPYFCVTPTSSLLTHVPLPLPPTYPSPYMPPVSSDGPRLLHNLKDNSHKKLAPQC